MKYGTDEDIRALELRIKRYIQFLIDDPDSENAIEMGEETLLPSHILEELGDDNSYYDDYDYEAYQDQGLPPVADLIQNQENHGIYNVRRLEQSKPLHLPSNKIDGFDQSAEWASRLQKLEPKFVPKLEPISQSEVRLRFLLTCDLYDSLKRINDLCGWKVVSYILQKQSERFIHLLEIIVIYDGLDNDLIEIALIVLGKRNLQKIILKSLENFQKEAFRYIKPLLDVPELPYAIEYYGDGFLNAFQEAALQDIRQDRETNIRALLIQVIEATQLLGKLGDEGKKLINYFGKDFAKEHLMEKTGLAMAVDLVNLGVPIWENILKDHIGIDSFKALFKENPRELAVRFMQMFRIPNSAGVIEILGKDRLIKLLQTSNQATLQLSTIGHLIEIRSCRCDDPEVVQKWHPGVLEILGLGARYPLVLETIDKIRHEQGSLNFNSALPEPDVWIKSAKNLLHILKLIQDAGFYPRPELALPILREPQKAKEIIQSYQRAQTLLLDIENFEIKNLFDINDSIDVTLAIAYGIVRNKISGNLSFYEFQLITKTALEYIKQGAVVPSIPEYAHIIELVVPKASFQQTKNFDVQSIEKLQAELLTLSDEASLIRGWQHIFDLSKAAGFRIDPEIKNQLDGFMRSNDLNNLAIIGFRVIFRWLIDRYNRNISEAMVHLLLGHLIQTNPDIRLRLQENEISQIIETLHETFFERLQDFNEHISLSFITVIQSWIDEQPISQDIYKKIKSTKTLNDIRRALSQENTSNLSADSETISVLNRLKKNFPLTTDLFLKYQNLVLKESSKIKTIESTSTMKIYLKPSRSLVNLFAGVYGEDCSLSPYHVERLFHPQHLFYQLFIEGSELLQGYISILKVNRAEESGLKFDVINPSNNVNINAVDFLKNLVIEFGKQADAGGIGCVGFSDQWNRISNRSSLIQAAQNSFSACLVEEGFELVPEGRYFQSSKGGFRVLWKKS